MDAATLALLSIGTESRTSTASIAASTTAFGSSWTVSNSWGTGTAPILTGRACDNTTTGAMPLPTTTPNLGSSGFRISRHRLIMPNGAFGTLLMDRLVDYGGGSGILITAQTVISTALTRYTSGVGNQLFMEVYASGASSNATTLSVSYTNESGTTGRTATLSMAAGWLTLPKILMIPLQQGDKGVQAIASFTLGTTSPNAGNFGITIAHPIGLLTSGNVNSTGGCGETPYRDITSFCTNPILSNACLYFSCMSNASATGTCFIDYSMV